MSSSTIESLSSSYDSFNEEIIPKYINEEYFLLKLIGKGGYSFVYIAYSIKNKKYYAIKIQDPEYYDDGKAEEKIINKLNSTNSNYFIKLYKTFDLALDDNICLCFVFEIMACSVYSLIRSGIYENGLPFNIVKEIIKQLLTSINIMHENKIIHSDIKPENILLCGTNTYLEEILHYMEKINIEAEYKKMLINNKKNKNKLSNKQIYELIAKGIYNTINSLDTKNKINNIKNNLNQQKYCDNTCSDNSNFERELLTSDSEYNDNTNSDDIYDNKTNQRYNYNHDILSNLNIKLTDFGGSYFFSKKPSNCTYTIYYSSPETILKYNSNEKIDIWAIGCVMYELLTGEILFEPKRTKKCGIDRNHIYEIQRIIGIIPNYIIQKSKKRDIFFRSDNTQKGITNFIPELLINKLKNKLKNYTDDEINFCHNLILRMLDYDYDNRISAKEALVLCQ
jgi:serine/threonine protein kinase